MKNALRDQMWKKILKSKGEGEEMRKTALFFFTGGLSQARPFSPILSHSIASSSLLLWS